MTPAPASLGDLPLFHHAPSPMALVDGRRILRQVNPAFCRLLGKNAARLVGKSLLALVPGQTGCAALIDRVRRTGKPESCTGQKRPRPGPLFWSYTLWPVSTDANRGCVMLQVTETVRVHERMVEMNEALILGSLRQHELITEAATLNARLRLEVAERQQAEAMLRRSEALFSALVAQAPVGIYVVDAGVRLHQINPRALSLFHNVHPLIGRDFSEILHVLWPARVAEKVVRRFRLTLKTGRAYRSGDFAERRKDSGDSEVYEWQIQRVLLPVGEYGVVCFFNNITERIQDERARRRLDMMTASNGKLRKEIVRRETGEVALKKSEKNARRLLDESHELQTRLRHISHRILTVQENQRKEISRELHDKITQLLIGINVHLEIFTREAVLNPQGIGRAIAPLRRLVVKSVRTVHQFSRELRPAMLDDLGLIPALRAYLDDFPKRKGRRIEFTAFDGVEALANDKRTTLYRVAQEALVNVARHARASVVKVSLLKARGGVCMEITDNGKAFDVERLSSARWSRRLGL
ncbi:MAG TPA: PAS domain-containing protein, partial [Rariglobus sp.]